MTRLIDADAFKIRLEHEAWSRGRIELLRARDIADETPTIDAVPVIRCKDCKHYADDACDRYADETLGYVHSTQADGFCWVAERKEE